MLMLVHPAREGQGTDPPKRRRGTRPAAFRLTAEESRHARAALKNAARTFGGYPALATAIGVPVATLHRANGKHRPFSGTLAIRLAKVAKVSVEAMLSGTLTAAGTCPTCGHVAGGGAR
jgi:hypothetical protein